MLDSLLTRHPRPEVLLCGNNHLALHCLQHIRRLGLQVPQERIEELAGFCRYAFFGFFIKFLWDRMEADPEESIDRLSALFGQFVDSALDMFRNNS